MTKSFSLTTITEGTTSVFIPNLMTSAKGPGEKQGVPFYNPAMELNRDLSVLVMQWFINSSGHHVHFLDGLAASGIRGLRVANEVTGDFQVTINDINKEAVALIQQNIRHLKLSNAVASQNHLNNVLMENRYECIDIDPFGSPIRFLDMAVQALTNNGILSVTATDTATLCGVYPKACLRRYAAYPFHGHNLNECAVRILLGVLCRIAAQHDKGMAPLMSYVRDHYIRIYVQLHTSVTAANQAMKQFRSLPQNHIAMRPSEELVGPLWTGPLEQEHFLYDLHHQLKTTPVGSHQHLKKLLLLLLDDARGPPFYQNTDYLSSQWKLNPPKMEWLLHQLQTQGFQATRTHFHPMGFRTNAPYKTLKTLFSQYMKE